MPGRSLSVQPGRILMVGIAVALVITLVGSLAIWRFHGARQADAAALDAHGDVGSSLRLMGLPDRA